MIHSHLRTFGDSLVTGWIYGQVHRRDRDSGLFKSQKLLEDIAVSPRGQKTGGVFMANGPLENTFRYTYGNGQLQHVVLYIYNVYLCIYVYIGIHKCRNLWQHWFQTWRPLRNEWIASHNITITSPYIVLNGASHPETGFFWVYDWLHFSQFGISKRWFLQYLSEPTNWSCCGMFWTHTIVLPSQH